MEQAVQEVHGAPRLQPGRRRTAQTETENTAKTENLTERLSHASCRAGEQAAGPVYVSEGAQPAVAEFPG